MSKTLDILIEVGSNTGYFPPCVPRRLLSRGIPYSRTGEIVEIVKREGRKNIVLIKDYKEGMFSGVNEGKIFMFAHDQSTFHTYNPETGRNVSYVIKTIVPEGRPWTIYTNPVSGERVHKYTELEDYRLIDEELNYGIDVKEN